MGNFRLLSRNLLFGEYFVKFPKNYGFCHNSFNAIFYKISRHCKSLLINLNKEVETQLKNKITFTLFKAFSDKMNKFEKKLTGY